MFSLLSSFFCICFFLKDLHGVFMFSLLSSSSGNFLSERPSKNFEDLSQNAKTQVVSAFTKTGLSHRTQ